MPSRGYVRSRSGRTYSSGSREGRSVLAWRTTLANERARSGTQLRMF